MMDSSYHNAIPILLAPHKQIQFIQVGCGGTGGFLAPMLARLIFALEKVGINASGILVDFDNVETVNVPRQNFCEADISFNKADVLATRYNLAYGIKLGAIASPFNATIVKRQYSKLIIVIGCVDNATARSELAKSLEPDFYYDSSQLPQVWWLDCGNFGEGIPAGQVLLGSTNQFDPQKAFNNPTNPNFCINLPSPILQHPELLVSQPEELSTPHICCAEIAKRNAQSLFINQRVAAEAIEMLSQLVLTKTLRRFATYFHCGSGSTRSRYCSKETLLSFSPNQSGIARS
ncbi:ThiF family adenylyltransferase [Microseira wollei]|uniref:UBA/THIF-type NAD/FAD binding fold protein n=1 Tax=Microseira wollei NIES-4236 TaxID=2530354 RepID=A0AAV3X6G6_9CYAN|nr:ThiF family adenylyltransferase [Microseira wollei]GET37713.1 UBA/THIF-type NAD/FAD binding fold protein [Microseira wollei NIES-4236]